jgi:NADPH:quinone reductase
MKAIRVSRFGAPEVLQYVDVPIPEPGPGQVRVAVHAAGVNPVDIGNRADGTWAGIGLPWTPGYDVAGVIDAVGADVAGVHVATRVMAMTDFPRGAGGYAEYVVVEQDAVAELADNTPYSVAAAAPIAAETALEVLRRLNLGVGERLLVLAASGGVGSYLVQLAALGGLQTVAMGNPEHHERLHKLGADLCMDYRAAEANERIAATGPVAAIADLVGGEELMRRFELLGSGGQVAAIQTPALNVDLLLDRNITFHGVLIGNDGARTREIAALLGGGRLSSSVVSVLPLADAAQAHRLVESRHAGGKVVLVPDPSRSEFDQS